jgi:CIC family chloride channel protein
MLGRTIFLAALVGVVSGVGAILFHIMCLVVTHYGLLGIAGYAPGGPAHETRLPLIAPEPEHALDFHPLLLLLLITVGGAVSGIIVYGLAPEAEGHGTDAAINAYHEKRGYIRPRVPLVKTVASAITLGTGGSGGREGPIAQIGAGFGSYLGTKLGLPEYQRRTLVTAGVGAGIGAIFHAPLAGAIFAIEVLYRDPEFEAEGLIPAFISTTVAYSVFALAFGTAAFQPLFDVPSVGSGVEQAFTRPFVLLLPLAVLALLMALAGNVYVRVFYGVNALFKKLTMPLMLKPAVGAFATGVLGVIAYFAMAGFGQEAQQQSLSVLYLGYGFLQQILNPADAEILWVVLLLVGVGKIFTTALTIGSGGSGGVFGPSMVIGGSLGSLVGVVFHAVIPDVVLARDVVIFAILGMASFFAAAAKTPVSTLIMVSELTAGYALLLPAMWCCALAYLSSGKSTLYREQKKSRRESPAHRGDFIIDVLKGLTIRQTLPESASDFEVVSLDTPLSDLGRLVTTTTQSTFPLVDNEGQYYGLFSLDDLRAFLYSDLGPLAVAQDLATPNVEPLTVQMDLSTALGRFATQHFAELPVVDEREPTKVIALLRRGDLVRQYNRQMLAMQSDAETGEVTPAG